MGVALVVIVVAMLVDVYCSIGEMVLLFEVRKRGGRKTILGGVGGIYDCR